MNKLMVERTMMSQPLYSDLIYEWVNYIHFAFVFGFCSQEATQCHTGI